MNFESCVFWVKYLILQSKITLQIVLFHRAKAIRRADVLSLVVAPSMLNNKGWEWNKNGFQSIPTDVRRRFDATKLFAVVTVAAEK